MVRDPGAERNEIRERDHRRAPRAALAGNRLRPSAPLHGRARRRVPRVGLREGRERLGQRGDRGRGPCGGCRDPNRGAGRPRHRRERARGRRGAGERRRDPRRARDLERGSPADVPRTARRETSAGAVRGLDPPVQVPRRIRQGESGPRRAARVHLPARRGPAPARRDLDQPERRLSRARLRRGEIRRVLQAPLPGHHHPVDDRSVHGAAGKACHVDLRAVRALSSQRRLDTRAPRGLRRRGHRHPRRVRAQHQARHPPSADRHARRDRAPRRHQRGQHLPRRAEPAADLFPAPGAGVGEVPDTGRRALAMRIRNASRRRRHGGAGAARRAGDPAGRARNRGRRLPAPPCTRRGLSSYSRPRRRVVNNEEAVCGAQPY